MLAQVQAVALSLHIPAAVSRVSAMSHSETPIGKQLAPPVTAGTPNGQARAGPPKAGPPGPAAAWLLVPPKAAPPILVSPRAGPLPLVSPKAGPPGPAAAWLLVPPKAAPPILVLRPRKAPPPAWQLRPQVPVSYYSTLSQPGIPYQTIDLGDAQANDEPPTLPRPRKAPPPNLLTPASSSDQHLDCHPKTSEMVATEEMVAEPKDSVVQTPYDTDFEASASSVAADPNIEAGASSAATDPNTENRPIASSVATDPDIETSASSVAADPNTEDRPEGSPFNKMPKK